MNSGAGRLTTRKRRMNATGSSIAQGRGGKKRGALAAPLRAIAAAIFLTIIVSTAGASLVLNSKTGSLDLNTSNTLRLRIGSDGNVGIGTAAPSHLLQIYTTPNNNALTINNQSGFVGIGKNNPTQALDVNGNLAVSGTISGTITGYTTWAEIAALFPAPDVNVANNITIKSSSDANFYNGITTNYLASVDNNTLTIATNNATRITVTADGNIGIATTTPKNKLNIIGDLNILTSATATPSIYINSTDGNTGIKTATPKNALNIIGDTNATGKYYGDGSALTNLAVFSNPATADLNMNSNKIVSVADINGELWFGTFITVQDSSPFSRDGSANGTITKVVGKLNDGGSFDGVSSCVFGTGDWNNDFVVGAYTFSAWVKTTSTQGDMRVFGTVVSGSADFWLGVSMTAVGGTIGKPMVSHYDGAYQIAEGTTDVNDGNWHLITGTWDGSRLVLYVDGSVDANEARSAPNIPGTEKWGTGCAYSTSYPTGTNFFNGQIDDAGIWARALTPAQVSTLYNSGTGAAINNADTNLQLAYHFDELLRKKVIIPSEFSTPDLNATKVTVVSPNSITAGNICYSDGTSCTALNPFNQDLNTGNSPTFNAIDSSGNIINSGSYSSQSNTGITNTTSYWACTTSDCSTTCQLRIYGGIITGCT